MIDAVDIHALERALREGIPLARAIDLRVADYDGNRLALSAPLAPNVNDKGCAFGGSMSSLLTLAAWGLVNLKLAEAGLAADVYVQDAQLSYLAPVWGELVAEATARDAGLPKKNFTWWRQAHAGAGPVSENDTGDRPAREEREDDHGVQELGTPGFGGDGGLDSHD